MAATERARPLATLAPDVPPAIAEVLDRGLAFDRSDRWPDARSMRAALCAAHRAAFGAAPAHVTLDEMMPGGLATAAPALAAQVSSRVTVQTPPPAPASGPPSASGMASTSARVEAVAPEVKKRPRRPLLVAAVLAVSATSVGLGLRAVTGPTASPVAPPSAASTALVSPPAAAASSGMAATLGPAASASDGAPAPAPSPTPAPARSAAHRPAPHVAPAPSTAQCEPPFYYDAQGNRVFKKECL